MNAEYVVPAPSRILDRSLLPLLFPTTANLVVFSGLCKLKKKITMRLRWVKWILSRLRNRLLIIYFQMVVVKSIRIFGMWDFKANSIVITCALWCLENETSIAFISPPFFNVISVSPTHDIAFATPSVVWFMVAMISQLQAAVKTLLSFPHCFMWQHCKGAL